MGVYEYARDAGLQDGDYYVHAPDSYLSVVHFDNGPDWYVEGTGALTAKRKNRLLGLCIPQSHRAAVRLRRAI